jgi:hypothetical protein
MYKQEALIDAVSKVVHEVLAHANNPIHNDEVVIPLFVDTQQGIELIHSIGAQLRGHGEHVWIAANRQTLIHKQVRVYVDANGITNPISVRGDTALMCIIDRHTNLSRYGQGVLAGTLSNSLMLARLAGYQGHVIALRVEDADDEHEED